MSEDCLKLTTYFGERDRTDGELLADRLLELYGANRIQASAMLRGIEGFGRHHSTHTELLLSLSEDLPVMSVAVDTRARIEGLLPEVLALKDRGLVTIERARLLVGSLGQITTTDDLPTELHDEAKLTVYLGRGERVRGRAGFVAVCETLQRNGILGATVLLGVDGTRHGVRARARFLGANPDTPLLVVSVGPGAAVAAAMAELEAELDQPIATLERVRVLRRDGVQLAEPVSAPPELPPGTTEWWQKLTVHSGEHDRIDGHPLHRRLVRRLRQERVAGATSLRGIWGFRDEESPHGDRLIQARRRTPVMTIVVDRPERIAAVYPLIAELTAEAGLVTLESVPSLVRPA